MNNPSTLHPGDRVTLNLALPAIDRTYAATYLGHTDTGFTVRVGAMTVERTYRWDDPTAWISDPRTGTTYSPENDDTLASITPENE